MSVKVRFAPSPTGYLHLGGLRTALYNYLFSQRSNGTFVLRIEDTDRNRYVPGAEEQLISTLERLGITWNEGPDRGGEYGPYRQSERTRLYQDMVSILVSEGSAYPCFCSPERLNQCREESLQKKKNLIYDRHCLSLDPKIIEQNLKSGLPHVIRLRIPDRETLEFVDLIHGPLSFDSRLIDDQILMKSDGFPTYHLANVVDDHFMKITHVIRGDEWLSSTPKHIALYRAFRWEIPEFAHLPLILNSDRTKLSKRQNDVAVENYLDSGFIPEGLINYLALLGWSNKDDREYYTIDDLINHFSIENVTKSGSIFDRKKLIHINGLHLRNLNEKDLLERMHRYVTGHFDLKRPDSWLHGFLLEVKDRIKTFDEISVFLKPFLEQDIAYDEKNAMKFFDTPYSLPLLKTALELIRTISPDDHTRLEDAFRQSSEEYQISFGKLAGVIRFALTGGTVSIGLFQLIELLGRETAMNRLSESIRVLRTMKDLPDESTQ